MKEFKMKFVSWLNSKWPERFCWTDCVSFVYSDRWNFFKISRPNGCKKDSMGKDGTCYCGQFVEGKIYKKYA